MCKWVKIRLDNDIHAHLPSLLDYPRKKAFEKLLLISPSSIRFLPFSLPLLFRLFPLSFPLLFVSLAHLLKKFLLLNLASISRS